MSVDPISVVIIIGAVAAVVSAAAGILNLYRARHRLIIAVIDKKASYDERGFISVEFHITNMTSRSIGLRRLGLAYSDGTTFEKQVNFFLEPSEPYVDPNGWQLFEDKERKRHIRFAFVEETSGRVHKANVPKGIKYFSQ